MAVHPTHQRYMRLASIGVLPQTSLKFYRTHNRYCYYVGRQHAHNNVLVCRVNVLKNEYFYQCKHPSCLANGKPYRSARTVMPDKLLQTGDYGLHKRLLCLAVGCKALVSGLHLNITCFVSPQGLHGSSRGRRRSYQLTCTARTTRWRAVHRALVTRALPPGLGASRRAWRCP